MNKKILFSLTTALCLTMATNAEALSTGYGVSLFDVASHDPAVCAGTVGTACAVDANTWVTIWLDPGLIAATGLDLLATMDQDERIIDATDALEQLEEAFGTLTPVSSKDASDTKDTSLSGEDNVVVAPEEIVKVLKEDNISVSVVAKDDLFDTVRSAVENYVFYTNNMDTGACGNLKPEDCILERQNTWLLTSVTMAAATGDKLLAATKAKGGKDPLEEEFKALVDDFNKQESPMGMWSSSGKITLHTHVQQNDINALYARDLEMNALNGVRESDDTRLLTK